MTQTLETYIRSVGTLSQASFVAQLDCPVLVDSPQADQASSSSKAFHTEFIDASTLLSRILLPSQREVIRVQKRQGAAFSTHISIGRTTNVDVSIPRAGISKFHAYFSQNENGSYTLTDKDSTNGSFVTGEKLEPGKAKLVYDGAEVCFGTHCFVFFTPARFFNYVRALSA